VPAGPALDSICARRHKLLCGQADSPLVHRLVQKTPTIAVENPVAPIAIRSRVDRFALRNP
jgi:hypothetical protein